MSLIEQHFRTTFNDAKASLLQALDAATTQDLEDMPSNGAMIRESALCRVETLLQVEKELEDIIQARDNIRRRRIAAQSLRSPIGLLPNELIHRIIEYVVLGPRDRDQIRDILQISHAWRDVILTMSRLFVSAAWNSWHPRLVDVWCRRANGLPLVIHLNDDTLSALDGFHKSSIMWGVLEDFRSM